MVSYIDKQSSLSSNYISDANFVLAEQRCGPSSQFCQPLPSSPCFSSLSLCFPKADNVFALASFYYPLCFVLGQLVMQVVDSCCLSCQTFGHCTSYLKNISRHLPITYSIYKAQRNAMITILSPANWLTKRPIQSQNVSNYHFHFLYH